MNWFQRHLNLTFCLSWVCVNILANLAQLGVDVIWLIVAVVLYICVVLWVLKMKGRSLWWVLFSISALFLSNKKGIDATG